MQAFTIKANKSNSPRVQSAIKKVIGYLHLHHGGWHFTDYMCRPDNFGLMVFLIAYKADKYDVLNRLATEMTAIDAIIILMHLLRTGRVSTSTINEEACRMVLEEFNESFKNDPT